jgi:hypothetical protein
MVSQLSEIGVYLACIASGHWPNTPPWLLHTAQFESSLHEVGEKNDTPTYVF